ncbi:hypothetical protein OAO18_07280 [Francisellaceae bacterium]|nr:hypothetical protein [Francisellaceae bacterium]
MHNIKILYLFIISNLFLFLLCSCATQAKYKESLEPWHGKKISPFIDEYGYPDRTVILEDGNKAYIYIDRIIRQNPAAQMPVQASSIDNSNNFAFAGTPGIITGGGVQDLHCKTWVVIDQSKMIIDIYFKGNNCVSY